jgi:hypothetical protein
MVGFLCFLIFEKLKEVFPPKSLESKFFWVFGIKFGRVVEGVC